MAHLKPPFVTAASLGLSPIVDVDGVKSVANPITFNKIPGEYRSVPPNIKK